MYLLPGLALIACRQDYTPKPKGYLRIDTGQHTYQTLNTNAFYQFDYSTHAGIEFIPEKEKEEWFNIVYPSWSAKIYCSYLRITPETFSTAFEDSRKFVFKHTVKADVISDTLYSNPEANVYGMIYDIKGDVASPVQFFLTDSAGHFFRGALYFENTPNQDSLAPMLDFIRIDIIELMESFHWKNKY